MSIRLRQWQAEAEAAYAASPHRVFLIDALPGGGKTVTAGVILVRQFLARHPNGRVILVVPTDHMRTQWTGVLARVFGVQVTSTISSHPRTGFRGVVTTYAGLAKNANTLRAFAEGAPCIGICDEVHHAGDRKSWGDMVALALDPCRSILALSGTPFRHDEAAIPFLRTETLADGSLCYVSDYSYDFPRALADRVVRSVEFLPFDGLARYRAGGFACSHLLREAPKKERATVLKILLKDPEYLTRILTAADTKLAHQRSRVAAAGGLAIAIDTEHAELVAEVIERVSGSRPDIVVSDDSTATSSVKGFAADPSRRWVVAVRMISEGVDVPRLMTMALLTNVSTRLFFRQAVGRVVRRQGDHDPLCSVYMPADVNLLAHAREIEQACADAKEMQEPGLALEDEALAGPGGGMMRREVEVLGVDTIEAQASVFKGLQDALDFNLPGMGPLEVAAPPLEERMEALRSEINVLAARWGRATGRTAHQAHRHYLTNVCKTPQALMSLQQLVAKSEWLRRRLGIASQDLRAASSSTGATYGE